MFGKTNTIYKENLQFRIVNYEEAYFKELGSKIRRLRIEKGIEQKAFAFDCGIARTQLYMIENGKVDMRITTLRKIAHGLDYSVSELLNLKTK